PASPRGVSQSAVVDLPASPFKIRGFLLPAELEVSFFRQSLRMGLLPGRGEAGLDEAIRKADILVEALGWIRQFRGRYVVIKLGGRALEEVDAVRRVLTDVIFLSTVGMKPILVHGGGKAITQAMNAAGIEPKFVNGRRFTDERTLEIVAQTLA